MAPKTIYIKVIYSMHVCNPISRTNNFGPKIMINGMPLDIVEEAKADGIYLQNNFIWSKNTDYFVRRGSAKIWTLRRLKAEGNLLWHFKNILYYTFYFFLARLNFWSLIVVAGPFWDF